MKHRLVDRILSWQAYTRIRGVKTVSLEEYCLKAALGDEPRLPESLVLEGIVQLGSWLMVLSSDFTQIGVLRATERVSFDAPLKPGRRMTIEITVHRYGQDGMTFDAAGLIGETRCASVTGCELAPLPVRTCADPDDLRVLLGEIYQPRGDEP